MSRLLHVVHCSFTVWLRHPRARSVCRLHLLTYIYTADDLALASSRDGEHFTFVERTPWLRPGVEGSVRSRKQWLAPPGPVRVGNQELFFVTGDNVAEWVEATVDPQSKGWHSEIAFGRLRLNGLVSLDAGYSTEDDAAILVTKPLIFAGQHMQVIAVLVNTYLPAVLNFYQFD